MFWQVFQDGNVPEMLKIWGEVWTNALDQFGQVFGPTLPSVEDIDPSEIWDTSIDGLVGELTAPEFGTASLTLAGLWLFFVLLTHTALWERLVQWEPPLWACVLAAIPMLAFIIPATYSALMQFDWTVHVGIVFSLLVIAALFPVAALFIYLWETAWEALDRVIH